MLPDSPTPLHGLAAPDSVRKGLYASEFYGAEILGYNTNNNHNRPPICAVRGASYPSGIAVDGKGNLIDPDGGTRSIIVFSGPDMCGSRLGSVSDPYGQPSDAASANAATGKIAVGNVFDNSSAGSISVCRLSGCTSNLTNPQMFEVAGVAMAKNSDCWASAANSSGTATLTYFKGCSGSGAATTGFQNTYYGGLDIDSNGYLVSISAFNDELYVYKNCNPRCTLVAGPFILHGEALFGHLNKTLTNPTFATADFQYGQIDVYKYSPKKVQYEYSFKTGLKAKYIVEGIAYNPRSSEYVMSRLRIDPRSARSPR